MITISSSFSVAVFFKKFYSDFVEMLNNSIINSNQVRLRDAANRLLQSVGSDENLINLVKPQVESLIVQVQSFFSNQTNAPSGFSTIPNLATQVIGVPQQKVNCDEKQRIAMRMNGFDLKENHIWDELSKRFGANIKRGELTNIAKVLADAANIKLDRDAKRRKSVLLKWFDEHWETISPLLDYIVLSDTETGNEDNDGPNDPIMGIKNESFIDKSSDDSMLS